MLSVLRPTASVIYGAIKLFCKGSEGGDTPRLEEGANGFRKCFELTYFLWFPTTPSPTPTPPPPRPRPLKAQFVKFLYLKQ
jgi:hypothetical protein